MDNSSSEVMPVSPVIFLLKAGETILSQFNKFYLTSLAALHFSNKNNSIPCYMILGGKNNVVSNTRFHIAETSHLKDTQCQWGNGFCQKRGHGGGVRACALEEKLREGQAVAVNSQV